MKNCRECGKPVSERAHSCPGCGAPRPAKAVFDGYGYEYISKKRIFGWPLLHVSWKYGTNYLPVPARGWIAIGQFAFGFITVSQFGIGAFSLSQFTIAAMAICQIGIADRLIAQVGTYFTSGAGQVVVPISQWWPF